MRILALLLFLGVSICSNAQLSEWKMRYYQRKYLKPYALIDKTGKIVKKMYLKNAGNYENGLAGFDGMIYEGGTFVYREGFFDSKGNIQIQPKFKDCFRFQPHCEATEAKFPDDKEYLINRKGEKIYDLPVEDAFCSNGYCQFKYDYKASKEKGLPSFFGVTTTDGKVLLNKSKYRGSFGNTSNNMVGPFLVYDETKRKFGYMKLDGTMAIDFIFNNDIPWFGEYLYVKGQGVYDRNGKIVYNFSEDKKKVKHGIIDPYLGYIYYKISTNSRGNDLYQIEDFNGNKILDFAVSQATFKGDYCIYSTYNYSNWDAHIKSQQKTPLETKTNDALYNYKTKKILIPAKEGQWISFDNEDNIHCTVGYGKRTDRPDVDLQNKYRVSDGKLISHTYAKGYSFNIRPFRNNSPVTWFQDNKTNKYGIIDREGKLVLAPTYDRVYWFSKDGYAFVRLPEGSPVYEDEMGEALTLSQPKNDQNNTSISTKEIKSNNNPISFNGGEIVLSLYGGKHWYVAKINHGDDSYYSLRYMDGYNGGNPKSKIKSLEEWKTSKVIEAKRQTGGYGWQNAEIVTIMPNNEFIVKYEDGKTEKLRAQYLREPFPSISTKKTTNNSTNTNPNKSTTNNNSNQKFQKDQLVIVLYSNGYYYPATIAYYSSNKYYIKFKDGYTGYYQEEKIKDIVNTINKEVEAKRTSQGYLKATLLSYTMETCKVKFEDGSTEEIKLRYLRLK